MEKKDVFISYCRKDTAIANKICAAFDRAGITYFIDRQGIGGGMEFPVVLANAILNCQIFLYLASNNSYASKFTNSEITFAFNEKPRNSLLPYIIDNSSLPLEMRFIFSGINWRNTTDHPIDTILVDDICCLLGREKRSTNSTSAPAAVESAETLLKGIEYYSKKAYAAAFPLLSKAAAMGIAVAQDYLGDCYYDGRGVPQDYSEAVKWFRKSAEQGNILAQNSLGECYNAGKGVVKDLYEAVKWYRKAAEQDNAKAQVNLGHCYEWGYGVNTDLAEAMRWYYRAAIHGNADAQERLGDVLINNRHEEKAMNTLAAIIKWYYKVAENGDSYAQYTLGMCFYLGKVVNKDYIEAVKWFRKAAEQGSERAQYLLGLCYYYGDGVDVDRHEAAKWYRKAANQGHKVAAERLRKMGL